MTAQIQYTADTLLGGIQILNSITHSVELFCLKLKHSSLYFTIILRNTIYTFHPEITSFIFGKRGSSFNSYISIHTRIMKK